MTQRIARRLRFAVAVFGVCVIALSGLVGWRAFKDDQLARETALRARFATLTQVRASLPALNQQLIAARNALNAQKPDEAIFFRAQSASLAQTMLQRSLTRALSSSGARVTSFRRRDPGEPDKAKQLVAAEILVEGNWAALTAGLLALEATRPPISVLGADIKVARSGQKKTADDPILQMRLFAEVLWRDRE